MVEQLQPMTEEKRPRIKAEFLAYLDMEYTGQVNARNKDPEVMNAYGFLQATFRDMLDSSGDLFNTITSTKIDRATVSNKPCVIYDFSSLLKRSRGVMVAQFVNALGFAVGNLTQGDVVVLHGAEQLAPDIKRTFGISLTSFRTMGFAPCLSIIAWSA